MSRIPDPKPRSGSRLMETPAAGCVGRSSLKKKRGAKKSKLESEFKIKNKKRPCRKVEKEKSVNLLKKKKDANFGLSPRLVCLFFSK